MANSYWWTAILLVTMVVLIPIELLLEAGIDESHKCRPEIKNSTGVCAATKKNVTKTEILASMLHVQNVDWADEHWDFVLEGASKKPNPREVRSESALRSHNRTFLVKDCKVETGVCRGTSACGNLTVVNRPGPFRVIVTNWTGIPRTVSQDGARGDLTWDNVVATVFIFWEAGSVPLGDRTLMNRTTVRAKGIEMILSSKEWNEAPKWSKTPWPLPVNASRARTYEIACNTDGLLPRDLAWAISMYRTGYMEQPGVKHTEVAGKISNLKALDRTDVAKAVYAWRADRWVDSCPGFIDVYTTCGTFNLTFILPFAVMAMGIILAWIVVHLALRGMSACAPNDAESWRRQAHSLAQRMNWGGGDLQGGSSDAIYDPGLFDVENITGKSEAIAMEHQDR